jgi:hypothetical protein
MPAFSELPGSSVRERMQPSALLHVTQTVRGDPLNLVQERKERD